MYLPNLAACALLVQPLPFISLLKIPFCRIDSSSITVSFLAVKSSLLSKNVTSATLNNDDLLVV